MYSTGTVTRSEAKVSKPLKGEIGGIGLRSPRVGGRGGIHLRIQEIGKNAKGRGVGEWPPGPLGTLGIDLKSHLKKSLFQKLFLEKLFFSIFWHRFSYS